MRRYPIHAQQLADTKIKAELFGDFALYCLMWRFVGLGHAARHGPIGLVLGVNEQHPTRPITQDHVSADPLAWLGGVALGEVRLPRFRITLIQRSF